MNLTLTLNDLKILHDAVTIQEEIAKEDESMGPSEPYTNLRERLKDAICAVENTTFVMPEIKNG